MGADSITCECGQCHVPLAETSQLPITDRAPCPACGSTTRHFKVNVSETLRFYTKLKVKARRPGMKRPFMEQTVGDDLQRSTGRWMKLERGFDRLKKWYHEEVTNPRTGEVVYMCEEPLPDHQGHGSAKKREKH